MPSDPSRPSDPIATDQGSDSIHTRDPELRILNVLNWPEVMLSNAGQVALRYYLFEILFSDHTGMTRITFR